MTADVLWHLLIVAHPSRYRHESTLAACSSGRNVPLLSDPSCHRPLILRCILSPVRLFSPTFLSSSTPHPLLSPNPPTLSVTLEADSLALS
ncbi:hypothetical protein C0Q70_07742 [Pomacea canaliculata]|uniref:Uncharacterized protein n=1 Tax=Pomacea canaliculata TaxID=400727 RepID=A0A2T7PFX8_POMCA|nr:hypothetical protein C0Q70_07742 [Pomacea canaliculata]